jgi:uncharacterized NAD(P)/FAD-binding protein YdhS
MIEKSSNTRRTLIPNPRRAMTFNPSPQRVRDVKIRQLLDEIEEAKASVAKTQDEFAKAREELVASLKAAERR